MCLIIRFSGHCELLFSLYCLLDLNCGECNVISLYILLCSVNRSVCFACLTICFGVVVILLLNVIVLFSVIEDALLDRPCMVFQRMCVLCL